MTTQADPTVAACANEFRLTQRDVPTDDSRSDIESCRSQIDPDPSARARRFAVDLGSFRAATCRAATVAPRILRGWQGELGPFERAHNFMSESIDSVVAFARIPASLPSNHISAPAQKFLLGEAGPQDARVGLIEIVCVCEFGNPHGAGSDSSGTPSSSCRRIGIAISSADGTRCVLGVFG